jgi:transposase InsO family protein
MRGTASEEDSTELALLHLAPQLAADACGGVAAAFVRRSRLEHRHRRGFAVVVHGHHREEAAVGMAHGLLADVFGHHLDADFHRRGAGVVDRCQEVTSSPTLIGSRNITWSTDRVTT